MIQLRNYQENAINELSEKAFKLWGFPKYRQNLIFESPTGSGKTLMVAEFLKRFCEDLPNRLDLRTKQVSFIWISPNKLYQQSHLSLKNYFSEKRSLRPIFFEDISEKKLQANEILFLNWESINKESNVYVRQDENGRSLYQFIKNTRSLQHEIIVIIDEEHLFTNPKTAKRAEEVLKNIQAKIELRVSATPQSKGTNVQVFRQEVIKEEMIKTGIILNPMLSTYIDSHQEEILGHTFDQLLIDAALEKRQEIAHAYEKLGVQINPLLLIQLPNDTKEEITSDDRKYIDLVLHYLNIKHTISTSNGRLAVWLSNRKENLSENEGKDDQKIRKNNSMVDVLLFKQAIAMGWDCPRAAVLLIFREIKSATFTIQTVGRILRMPEQKHYTDALLNQGYVYTNLSKDIIQVVRDDMDFISFDKAIRKESYQAIELHTLVDNSKTDRNRLGSRYKKALFLTAENFWGLSRELGEIPFEEINKELLKKRLIELDRQKIEIIVPENIYLTGEEQIETANKTVRFARNFSEIKVIFYNFCKKNIGSYAVYDSTPILQQVLIEFFERYLLIQELDAMKIILYNQSHFVELIGKSLFQYEKTEKEAAANRKKIITMQNWEIPKERIYTDLYVKNPSKFHVLEPFFELQNASRPEKEFVKFLEKNEAYLDWWYKNGDKGKEHFAISYQNSRGETALFYIDFVLRLKSGKIALFDTKTPNSDSEAAAKHNALLQYCEQENQKGKNLMGSIVLYKENALGYLFLYQTQTIQDTNQTRHWEDLELGLKSW